ncbi:n6-adenosine-methyltransferase 70 kda subunit [Moniliophthora roreri MCA 2997]|uniref:mRNA m(6)A methyltransferase n=1 Tax=Moniliophthora roreri (strain MCA 2997) TaxID=1381753 RepID=V2XX56_MONRO|nr:n6-adenosine-methyltransferase 70 kda subunit [Moniliophthora roreri MCA 2997]
MSDELSRLKIITSTVLLNLLKHEKISMPISSRQLLVRVVTHKLPPNLFPDDTPLPRFKLTDQLKFEGILEELSKNWDQAELFFTRDSNSFVVTDVVFPGSNAVSRKRKRVIDEEADSAAGDQPEEEEQEQSPLARLSKEQRQVYAILQQGTAKSKLLAEQFKAGENSFEPICPHITKDECFKSPPQGSICDRIHFRPLIRQHTDPSLGHCSYLNTCYSEPTYAQSPSIPPFPGQNHVLAPGARGPTSLPSGLGAGGRGKEKAPCRYLHYEVDWDPGDGDQAALMRREKEKERFKLGIGLGPEGKITALTPPQWINCDLRRFDYSVLGKFHVIMADPPWDIHMSLPYGTMTDDEMRAMPIPTLQDEGLLFLWVTGRAMEVGRECLRVWGYTRVDEVVWVKTNQLQRVIRTGRTGHWLNHTKEHMLVGVKTSPSSSPSPTFSFPKWVNRGLDTDVIVSEVRETSRKPDEVYGLIERMCPGGRKIEIFGRKHNTRPGWLTLGNQLGPTDQIWEEDVVKRVKAKYPDRVVSTPVVG